MSEYLFFSHDSWDLSLNGKDGISGDDQVSLSSLGLVSGDLIHVIAVERPQTSVVDPQTSVVDQLLQMGFEKVL